jgi:hypothetical protein
MTRGGMGRSSSCVTSHASAPAPACPVVRPSATNAAYTQIRSQSHEMPPQAQV